MTPITIGIAVLAWLLVACVVCALVLRPRRPSRESALKRCGSMAGTWREKRGTVVNVDGTFRARFATSTTQSRQAWEERARLATSAPEPIPGCRLVMPPIPPASPPARARDRMHVVRDITQKRTG